MPDIISPTRLLPGNLQFPQSNAGAAGYEDAEKLRIYKERASREQTDWTDDRERSSEEDAAALEQAQKYDQDPQPQTSTPLTPPTLAGDAGQPDAPTSAEAAPPAPPPATSPSTGLSAVSSGPVLPTPKPQVPTGQLSAVSSSPSAAPSAPPPATPPPGNSPLSAVSSAPVQDPTANYRQGLAQSYVKHGLGKLAVETQMNAIGGQKAAQDKEYEVAMKVLTLAQSGHVQEALLLAQQHGEKIDAATLSNAQAVEAMLATTEAAHHVGAGHDQAWQQKFMQNYNTTHDIQSALNAAGKPAPAPAKVGTFKFGTGNVGGKDQVVAQDTTTGKITPTGTAAPIKNPNQRQTNEQINYHWMTSPPAEGGLGLPSNVAQKLITEVKNNPGARANTIMTAANALITSGRAKTLDQAMPLATKAYNEAFKAAGGGSGGGTVKPSAATVFGGDGEKQTFQNDAGDEIYTTDGGKTYWNAEDDTPYNEGG